MWHKLLGNYKTPPLCPNIRDICYSFSGAHSQSTPSPRTAARSSVYSAQHSALTGHQSIRSTASTMPSSAMARRNLIQLKTHTILSAFTLFIFIVPGIVWFLLPRGNAKVVVCCFASVADILHSCYTAHLRIFLPPTMKTPCCIRFTRQPRRS